VTCDADYNCVCKQGFCADAKGKCVEQPVLQCKKKVSTCQLWPHHCSKSLHGGSVFCSADFKCLCGEGTCEAPDSELCAAPAPFGAAAALADRPLPPELGGGFGLAAAGAAARRRASS